jgi:hypothetical protein
VAPASVGADEMPCFRVYQDLCQSTEEKRA